MNRQLSNRIININFILTIFIVLLHCNNINYSDIYSEYTIINILLQVIRSICDIAVPTFFLISSYLFFRNFDMSKVKEKFKSRIHSLLVPYLSWFIFLLILLLMVIIVKYSGVADVNIISDDMDNLSFLKSIICIDFNVPLWYIRVLMVFVILSPILYILINKLKKINFIIIIVVFLINIIIEPNYYRLLFWIPIYYMGAYLTVNYKNKLEKEQLDLSKSKYIVFAIYGILLILTCILYSSFTISYIYKMFSPIFVFTIFYKNKFLSKNPLKITKNTFMIYCIHYPIIVLLNKILIVNTLSNSFFGIIIQFLKCIFVIFLSNLIVNYMRKFTPKTLNILSGNRC